MLRWLTVTCGCWLGVGSLLAQDPPGVTVLRTGGGLPLVTSSQQLQIASNSLPTELYFEFGFGTDETPSPGAILDSFTVTVQDAAMINSLLLLTADASGVVWSPSTPGGIVIPPDSILRSAVAFPSLQPVLANQTAFAVTVPLPTVFSGPVNVYFDLFDNLNPNASLGWYRGLAVPEPQTWTLLTAGLLAVCLVRSWRRRLSRVGVRPSRRGVCLVALFLGAVGSITAQEKSFQLHGITVALEEVTPEVDVFYQSMRFNRAAGIWNVEVLLSNKSSRAFSGPLIYYVEGFANTSGPLQPDGLDGAKAYYDVSAKVADGMLTPGERSLPYTLSLGFTSGSPSLTNRIFARGPPAVGAALAFTRTLNEAGQLLPSVSITEVGPLGQTNLQSDPVFGVATLGRAAGNHVWRFGATDYLPVWRMLNVVTGRVDIVPHPWLTRRSTNTVSLTPLAGGSIESADDSLQVQFAPGAVATVTGATLTPLTGQTLPGLLPLGWSPLQAFWLEMSSAPLAPGTASFELGSLVSPADTLAFVQWDESNLRWNTLEVLSVSSGNSLTSSVPTSGAYALVVGDPGDLAPPSAQPGQPLLPSPALLPDSAQLTATGTVTPSSSPASRVPELVTGTANVELRHATQKLPSGYLLRGEVTETYLLADGSIRLTPQYEHFVVCYQRPGDSDPFTVHSQFPMRPLLLFDTDELEEAAVRVDVLSQQPFDGQVLDDKGGQIAAEGVRVLAGSGRLTAPSALRLRRLDATVFTNLMAQGHTVVAAFDLMVDSSTVAGDLNLQLTVAPAGALFVLTRVLSGTGYIGLKPIERLSSDAQGNLTSLEPATGERLPGLRGSGQFVLVRVDDPQGLITGIARNGTGAVQPNMPVQLTGLPWLTLTDTQGRYQLVSPTGDQELGVRDPLTGDSGFVAINITDPAQILTQDLATAPSGPRVAKITPADGATRIPRVVSVVIEFNEAVNPATVVNAIQLLTTNNIVVPAALTLNLANRVATLSPATELQANTVYRVKLAGTIADPGGLPLAGQSEFSFTTVPPSARIATAQLVIYEPGATNVPTEILDDIPAYTPGSDPFAIVVHGQPGVADPEVAVILVNESTGETATVLSKPDGSFSSVISGTEEDFVSATFINLNNTRTYVPVSRQLFDNGFVGLYSQGGILEAQSDGGPVQVIVEPAAIQTKSTFKIEAIPLTELISLLGTNGQPEAGQLVGGFRAAWDGDTLKESADLVYPVDPSTFNLPTNVPPEQAEFGLFEIVEVNGVTAHALVDSMSYADGKLKTASPPQPGLFMPGQGLAPGEGGLVANYSIILISRQSLLVTGKVVQQADSDTNQVTEVNVQGFPPVPGAIVSGGGRASSNPGLRPGAWIARASSNGFYVLRVPNTVFDPLNPDAVPLKAESFRFPGRVALKTIRLSTLGDAAALATIANLVFRVPTGGADNDQFPPLVSLANPQAVYPINTNVTILLNAFDNASQPIFENFDWVRLQPNANGVVRGSFALGDGSPLQATDVNLQQGGVTGTSGTSAQKEYTLNVNKSAFLLTDAVVRDGAGNVRTNTFALRFGQPLPQPDDALQPHDPADNINPRVVWMIPGENVMVTSGTEIRVRFSEAISQSIETSGGVQVNGSASGAIGTTVELSPDQLSARIFLAATRPGESITLQLSGNIQDLAGNALDHHTGTYRIAPAPNFTLNGVLQPVGALSLGNHTFTLDRSGNGDSGALRVHRSTDLTTPNQVGSLSLPPFPRAMAIVPNFSYRRTPGGIVETNKSLVVVSGGVLGEGQIGQWLWVIDISNPATPVRLGSGLASIDFASAITTIKYESGFIFFVINNPEGGVFYKLNLQAFILGSNYSPADWEAALITGPLPGNDLNSDGDFVDAMEELPVPQRNTIWGVETPLPVSGGRFVYDFDVLAGGAFWAATFSAQGAAKPSRLQVLTFGGLLIGLGDTADGAVIFPNDTAFRVLLDQSFPLVTTNGVQSIPLVAIVAAGKRLEVYDLASTPTVPKLVRTISFPTDAGTIRAIIRLDDHEYGVATAGGLFVLKRDLMGMEEPPSGQAHPALVERFDGQAMGRSFGVGQHAFVGLSSGGLKSFLRPPRISVIRAPAVPVSDLASLVAAANGEALRSVLTNAVREEFLTPAPLISFGTDFPSAIANPPNPTFHYYALLQANGSLGAEINLMLESLDGSGRRLNPKGELFAPVILTDHAGAYGVSGLQPDAQAVRAYRLSSDPTNELFNTYVSSPFLVVRDLYSTQVQSDVKSFAQRQAIQLGGQLRVSVEKLHNSGGYPGVENSAGANGTIGLCETVLSMCADCVDSFNPSARQVSPVVDGVSVQSGEFRYSSTDLFVEGRGQNLGLTRHYESQTHFAGPFGRGWDFNYNRRLCELPLGVLPDSFRLPLAIYGQSTLDRIARPGDVILNTGDGDLKLYRRIGVLNGNENLRPLFASDPAIAEFGWANKIAAYYEPPRGDFEALFRFSDGAFVVVDATGNRTFYGADGRLTRIVLAYEESETSLTYRGDGKLKSVSGDNNVDLEFGYYGRTTDPSFVGALDKPASSEAHLGLIARVKAGPLNAEYFYDSEGNLVRFKGATPQDVICGYDQASPYQLTTIGRGDGTIAPAQRITYSSGLVTKVESDGTTTTFGGAVATAEQRQSAGNASLTVSRGGGGAQVQVDNQGRTVGFAGQQVELNDQNQVRRFGKPNDQVEFVYDEQNSVFRFRGNVTEVKKGSYSATAHYDGSAWNRIDNFTTPEGVTTTFSYTGDKPGTIVTQTTGPRTRTARFNAWGVLTREDLTEGGTTFSRIVEFDSSNLPRGFRLGNQAVWTFNRSPNGVSQFGGGALTLTPQFNTSGQLEGLGAGSLFNVAFGYDSTTGKQTSSTISAGGGSIAQTLSYDPTVTDRIGTTTVSETGVTDQTVTFSYDGNGRLTGNTRNGITTTIGYTGIVPSSLSAPGLQRSIAFNANGEPTTITEQGLAAAITYDGDGRVKTYESAGAKHTFNYNSGDRVSSYVVTDSTAGGTLVDETYTYDAAGRVGSTTSSGTTWSYTYFPDNKVRSTLINGQEVNSYTRDGGGFLTDARFLGGAISVNYSDFHPVSGQPRTETVTLLDGTSRTETHVFDDAGRLKSVSLPEGVTTTYGYDGFGHLSSVMDGDGVVMSHTHSPSGLPLTTTFGDGTSISYNYNSDLTLDSQGNVQYSYDSHLLPSQVTYPDGTVEVFAGRNQFFEPETVTLGGVAQIHSWQHGRRQSVVVNSTGDNLQVTHDGLGRPTFITLNGYTVQFGYEPRSGVIRENTPLGTWALTLVPIGHVTREDYPSGYSISYGVAGSGVPTSAAAAGVTSASWMDVAAPTRVEFAGGISINWEYDGALRNRAIRYELTNGGQTNTVAGFEYVLTPGNRVVSETRLHENATDVYVRNGPSEGMRITGVNFSAASPSATNSTVAISSIAFNPDGEVDFSGSQTSGSGARVILPGAGDALMPNSQGSAAAGPIWVNLAGVPSRFDAQFTYDGFNQLRRVERFEGGQLSVTVEYQRDGLGRVVRKTVTGPPDRCRPGTWRYAWKNDKLIEEYYEIGGTNALVVRYLYLGENLVMVQSAPAPGDPLQNYIPLVSLNGSIGGFLNPDGTIAEFTRYGLYGLPEHVGLISGTLSPRSAVSGTLKFQGAFFDEETGLYHIGQRVLHPVFGRFLQRDADLYIASRALFTAFNGDPASNIDPSGSVTVNAIGWKEPATWRDAPQMIAKGGLAAIKPTLFEDPSRNIKFFISSNSKGFGFASFLVETMAGATVGDSQVKMEFFQSVAGVLDLAKYVTKGIEEWQDWSKTQRDLRSAFFAVKLAEGRLGRAHKAFHQYGVMTSKETFNRYAQAQKQAYKARMNYIFARTDRVGNILGIGKVAVGIPKAIIKDILHWEKQDDKLKYVGLVEAASSSLSFGTALSGAVTTDRLWKLAGGSTALEAQTIRRLSVHGGFLDVPASSVTFKALSVYQAFDAGFTAGKGGVTFGLGMVDPALARDYHNAVKSFEKEGGFLTTVGGFLDYAGAPNDVVNGIQNFHDATFLPDLRSFTDSLQANPPFDLYYRGLNAP